MKPLTDQQDRVLSLVAEYVDEKGFPPTLREIGERLGLSNLNAVRGHLLALERKGYITKDADKARSIRVVHAPSTLSRFKRRLHEVFRTDEGVLHRVVYGLAWTTWQRAPALGAPQRDLLEKAFDREAVEHGWRLLERRIQPDHVVLVVETWPNHSAHLTVRRFQAAAEAVRRRHPAEFAGRRLWARGYAATTDLSLLETLVQGLLREGD